MPCSHCMQLKNIICSYPEVHSSVANRRTVSKPPSNPLSYSNPLSTLGDHPSTAFVPETPSSSTSPLPRSLPSLVDSSQSERGSLNPTPVEFTADGPSEKNVQTLANRSRNGEQRPSSASSLDKHTDEVMSVLGTNFSSYGDVMLQVGSNHPTRVFEPSYFTQCQEMKGEDASKTQFFGRSHWMNTFNMVCRHILQRGHQFNKQSSRGSSDTKIKTAILLLVLRLMRFATFLRNAGN